MAYSAKEIKRAASNHDFNQAKMIANLALADEREKSEEKAPIDLENAFWTLKRVKTDMAIVTFAVDQEIYKLMEEKKRLEAPFQKDIQTIEKQIKEEVDGREASFKCEFGSAVYRHGSVKTEWDDKALLGFAAAGHPEIEQFRSESEGKSSIVLKVVGF